MCTTLGKENGFFSLTTEANRRYKTINDERVAKSRCLWTSAGTRFWFSYKMVPLSPSLEKKFELKIKISYAQIG
ncbi:hypothetical protein POVCU2_0016890 [Plasmodium ovale curtisi]|uniref:Uncharacterized protein n=1 Tax=Plasmodium ovale curtisi TaxID=864141 RepID=A0A1A8VV93_PLAOA|nr:hypothetical protein POVCU2_0016890 [Plasmodium ovale curtisi]SBS87720.1 hypothetical protein POVCU1_015150 [Plasmodium ovale curtisi]